MKGLIFFLFLLAHTTMVWAATLEPKEVVLDTLDNKILETEPEINLEKYVRKMKLFNDSILNYLATQCIETVLKIQDNVVVKFIVNGMVRSTPFGWFLLRIFRLKRYISSLRITILRDN